MWAEGRMKARHENDSRKLARSFFHRRLLGNGLSRLMAVLKSLLGDEYTRYTLVKHMSSQPQGGAADFTAETLSVEEVAFCAQSLHHIHTLLTEVTGVTATHPGSKLLPQVNLKC